MKKIFIAGHNGMVGSAILEKLQNNSNVEVITRNRCELDLCDQSAVFDFMKMEKPDEVILAAAKVGGIYANNTYPAEFIYQNLQIQNNVIHSAHINGVQKLLFLGSSCIYPRAVEQPMLEDALLTNVLEPTNEPYAIAKISGIKMCESYNRQYGRDYRSLMPTNLYGPGDNFNVESSHVIPGLIHRMHLAKLNGDGRFKVWGSGKVRREFLYVSDLSDAAVFLMDIPKKQYDAAVSPQCSHINAGFGSDVTINELVRLIADIVGYSGDFDYDKSFPDGPSRKLVSSQKMFDLGWYPKINLEAGLKKTYEFFLENDNVRIR